MADEEVPVTQDNTSEQASEHGPESSGAEAAVADDALPGEGQPSQMSSTPPHSAQAVEDPLSNPDTITSDPDPNPDAPRSDSELDPEAPASSPVLDANAPSSGSAVNENAPRSGSVVDENALDENAPRSGSVVGENALDENAPRSGSALGADAPVTDSVPDEEDGPETALKSPAASVPAVEAARSTESSKSQVGLGESEEHGLVSTSFIQDAGLDAEDPVTGSMSFEMQAVVEHKLVDSETELQQPDESAERQQSDEEEEQQAGSAGSRGKMGDSATVEATMAAAQQQTPPSTVPVTPKEKESITTVIPLSHLPSYDRPDSSLEGTMSNSALNIVWSFGMNRNVPVLNLSDGVRKAIMYPCSHVGVMYDYKNNKQYILQGHKNTISCTCVSEDRRWLVTGDKGPDSMVNVWDTYTGVPIQTLFDPNPEGGVEAVALTTEARYLATLSASSPQILAIWDWTIDGEMPVCSADLKDAYGIQNYIHFNTENIHHIVTNSETQVLFFRWNRKEEKVIEYYAPPLTDSDFNKPVGRYSQSIYLSNSSRALTATSIGNLVMWDNNKPLTRVVSTEQSADKKALKIIKIQDKGINVLGLSDKYIVLGDQAGQVRFFDQSLKLLYWYQYLRLGPVTSVSFSADPSFQLKPPPKSHYPRDASIPAPRFVVRDFVVGSSLANIGSITTNGSKVELIQQEHEYAVHALAVHPLKTLLAMGSYSGFLKIWDYKLKEVMVTRMFDRGHNIQSCVYDPKGVYLVVGFTSGMIRVVDSITLQDEILLPFSFARAPITQIVFSHDSQYFATADSDFTTSLYRTLEKKGEDPFVYLGRFRAHYKPIRDLMFCVHPETLKPRLLSLGADRMMVEYDLENIEMDKLLVLNSDRIEQSAIPTSFASYPPVTKETFIMVANNQLKVKLFNATTKMCRQTLLGPTYGAPLTKIKVLGVKTEEHYYAAYTTDNKVGLTIIPLDGNPHNSMALIAHPTGVSGMATSSDGCYIFTAGGQDCTVHMWEINIDALEGQAALGGKDLVPFYGLLEGGNEGELYSELEDFFYYAQIRNQGVDNTETRKVSTSISLTEVPFVMRAMGFYPTEQEVEDMMNEVKFSRYVETGQFVEELDLGTFIKLYVNHRPAFGLAVEKLQWAFDVLGQPSEAGGELERGELLDLLQNRGEHMTEYELAEYLTTLLGFMPEGGSSELHRVNTSTAGDIIEQTIPHLVNAPIFARDVLGFPLYEPPAAIKEEESEVEVIPFTQFRSLIGTQSAIQPSKHAKSVTGSPSAMHPRHTTSVTGTHSATHSKPV